MEEDSSVKDFNVFVGAENGILKCVSVNPKGNILKNFNNQSTQLDREQEITCLDWDGDNEGQFLVGLRNQTVRAFSIEGKSFNMTLDAKAGHGPLRGVARFDDNVVTACESGIVRVWEPQTKEHSVEIDVIETELNSSGKLAKGDFDNEETKMKHLATLKAGRNVSKMRQCPAVKNQIATGGKENRLQVWDLNKPESGPIFAAKNVKHDTLELRVPVWVTDFCYPDAMSESSIATVSRYGHIRLYDTRSNQRRPIHDLLWEDEALTSIAPTQNDQQILVGSGTGNLALYDFRAQHRGMFRKYKGCVGSVRSIYSLRDKPFFAVVGLDRFLRIFSIASQKSVHKMYLKSRLNCVLLSKDFDPSKIETKVEDRKSKPAVEDVRPEVEVVEDERFWAKIPVIREKRAKKTNQAEKKKSRTK